MHHKLLLLPPEKKIYRGGNKRREINLFVYLCGDGIPTRP